MESSRAKTEKTVAAASDSRGPLARESLDEGDVSLIRWMLELTPTERLETAQDFLEGALALRDGRKVSN